MRRLALLGGLLAVIDIGLITVRSTPEGVGPAVAPRMKRVVPAPVERDGLEVEWVAAILERPLFEVGRRPLEPAGGSVGEPETLPRLTGIIVWGSTRRALFVTPIAVTRSEGERLGAFTVTSIRPGAVDVAGPEGLRTLYPASDAGFRAELAATRPLAALMGMDEREMWTETDQ